MFGLKTLVGYVSDLLIIMRKNILAEDVFMFALVLMFWLDML